MDKNVAIDLFLYRVILTGFTLLGHRLQTGIALAVLWSAGIGGIFVSILAVLGVRGFRIQPWCLATLSLLAILLIVQAGKSWFGLTRDPSTKATPLVVTLLFIFALGQRAALVKSMSKPRSKDDTHSGAAGKPSTAADASPDHRTQ